MLTFFHLCECKHLTGIKLNRSTDKICWFFPITTEIPAIISRVGFGLTLLSCPDTVYKATQRQTPFTTHTHTIGPLCVFNRFAHTRHSSTSRHDEHIDNSESFGVKTHQFKLTGQLDGTFYKHKYSLESPLNYY